MRLLESALARPRRTLAVAAAAAAALVGTPLLLGHPWDRPPAPARPAGTALPGSPAADAPALGRLVALAAAVRADPAHAAATDPGLVRHYLGARGGASVAGQFAVAGASGACYVLTVTADRTWLSSGDRSGLHVSGPVAGPAAACDPATGS